jgi:sugar O-acyltransferase (sialic acid O-acetyltransferase NeuD family)
MASDRNSADSASPGGPPGTRGPPPIIIVGCGGHGLVVADALLASDAQILGFTDADPSRHGQLVCGLVILGSDDVLDRYEPDQVVLVNGIAGARNEAFRRVIQQRLSASGRRFVGVRHPSAIVSPFASVADDVQLLAGCIVQAEAVIGNGGVVNTAAVIEHHVRIGDFVHVAPRAVICGGATIGGGSHLGAGCVIRQGIHIGPGVLVGAGAVVVKDFSGPGMLLGVPARAVDGEK